MFKSFNVFTVPVHLLNKKECIDYIFKNINNKQKIIASTPNAEILVESLKNEKLRHFLKFCHLNIPDSFSLVWASKVINRKYCFLKALFLLFFLSFSKQKNHSELKKPVCGSDLFLEICQESQKYQTKILLLGGKGKVPQKTKTILEKKYPKINILGAFSGSPYEKDDLKTLTEINKLKPEILFVAYGCPLQELFIARNFNKIPSLRFALGIGGSFDFVAGNQKRAPVFFRKIGFEWFYRLIKDPKRLPRIFKALIIFPYYFLFKKK
jgi:N-acetylglucosaminyldiphosphoundecaprenol N-acetyl-beta-D-mannosaminyltransferase